MQASKALKLSRRVVVTGVGLVSPLGCGSRNVWDNLIAGHSGIDVLPEAAFVAAAGIHVAAKVPLGENPHEYDEKRAFDRLVGKEQSQFIQYANYAADIALAHAGDPLHTTNIDRTRVGVAISSGVGALQEVVDGHSILENSYRKLSPFFIPKILINLAAGQVSVRHGLQGPCHSTVTACAASAHSIGDALNFIRLGYADMMLAGGSIAIVSWLRLTVC